MLAHLWAAAPAPPEYAEMALCREFKVLPSQLRNEPMQDVLNIMTMMSAEAKVKQARSRVKRRK